MKRKVTYLIKHMDIIIKEVLSHTKDLRTQAQLLKNKQNLKDSLIKLEEKYIRIIDEIKKDIEDQPDMDE
jgi:hypothetical protein